MKIKYEFKKLGNDDYRIFSNLKVDSLDILELLSSDVVERTYPDFINCMNKKEIWCSNATKVDFEGGMAVISPAFSWSDDDDDIEVYIPIKELKQILEKWIDFLKRK